MFRDACSGKDILGQDVNAPRGDDLMRDELKSHGRRGEPLARNAQDRKALMSGSYHNAARP